MSATIFSDEWRRQIWLGDCTPTDGKVMLEIVERQEQRILALEAALRDVRAACRADPLWRQFDDQNFWHAHHVDIIWRHDGKDQRYQADWLKDIWYAVRRALLHGSQEEKP